MLALLVLLVTSATAVFAGLASGGVVTKSRRGTIKAAGLTPAERRAIAVKSVTATDDPSLGLIVTVTFKGDVERYLGQGDLNRALAALVLLPKSPRPSGVLDQDGGFARATVPILERHGNHLRIERGTIDLFSPERMLSTIAPQNVAVIRDNDKLIFSIDGPVLGNAARLQLKLFAKSPLETRRQANGARAPSSSSLRKILATRPSQLVSLNLDTRNLTCDQLDTVAKQLSGVSSAVNRELRHERQALADLRVAIDNYPAIKRLAHKSQLASKSTFAADSIEAAATTRHLNSEIASIGKLTARIDALKAGCGTPPPSTTASPPPPPPAPTVKVVQTDAALSQYLAPRPDLNLSANQPEGVPLIDVNDQVRFQRFSGIGASMTDSSAWLIYDQLSASDRAALLKNLFGSDGIRLNFLRVPMAASDFTVSSHPYSYDDMPAGQSDPTLSQFSIAHDLPYIVRTLKESLAVNPQLEILANPWSPPGWMKSNDSMDNINGQGTLLSSADGPLANYFVKFIEAYKSNGVKIDAITPQNEPRSGGAGTSYPGLTLPEPDEANLISQYLQPALQDAGLHPKIYGNDLSWDQESAYADPLATGSTASNLAGIAWHCYFGLPTAMTQVHQDAPALDAIADECSPEIRNFHASEYLISSLRNWASVVSVWNVALDPQGGPKEPTNGCPGCTGVVTIDETSHKVSYSLEYYRLGQVSSFVQPGATRVDSPNFVTYTLNTSGILTVSAGLDDVAFLNPDGSKVLVANNTSTAPISFAVHSQAGYFTYTIPAQAMTTFTWP
jgi:glucosylceramidase